MIVLAKRVSRRFVPTQEIFTSCAIDLATATALWAMLWAAYPYMHPWMLKVGDLAVHVLVLMAIWNPLQHMRRQYHVHVRRALSLVFGDERLMPGGPASCPACGEIRFGDRLDDRYGEDGMQAEGTRTFACGTVLNSHRGTLQTCPKGSAGPDAQPRR